MSSLNTIHDWDLTNLEADASYDQVFEELARQDKEAGHFADLRSLIHDATIIEKHLSTTNEDPPTVYCPGHGWEHI